MRRSFPSALSLLGAVGVMAFALMPGAARADSIFVANYFSGALTKFDSSGSSAAFGNTKVDGTFGLTCDAAGNLYVGMILGPIEKWDPTGHESVLTSVNKNVGDLATDGAGNIYAINTGSTMGVQEFSPTGALLRTVTPSAISAPRGLAIDAAGNIFLGCHLAGSSVIEKITPSGGVSVLGTLASPIVGLAFDLSGKLFALAGGGIYEYAPNGTRSIFLSGGLANTQGLAIDSAGNLYVVATANTIDQITPAGTISTFGTASLIQNIAVARTTVAAAAPTDTPTLPVWALGLLAGALLLVAGRGTLATSR